uniref:Alternative protein TEF n=1 Tax=Homo sapiens TaxID=9606 RepID=L8E7U2_HUMAN|nr:alternative protein TEF [Homo sapiens]
MPPQPPSTMGMRAGVCFLRSSLFSCSAHRCGLGWSALSLGAAGASQFLLQDLSHASCPEGVSRARHLV